jgi:hypothetical protein
MIILDFLLDEETFDKDLRSSPETANAAALEQTFFVVPVRFASGETELLSFPGAYDAWRPQPLIGFATHLVVATQGASPGTMASCHLADGGRLDFERIDYTIRVSSTLLPQQVEIVKAVELVRAARDFRERVRTCLSLRVPALSRHPWWGKWFPLG